jgi:hypothetical protein
LKSDIGMSKNYLMTCPSLIAVLAAVSLATASLATASLAIAEPGSDNLAARTELHAIQL